MHISVQNLSDVKTMLELFIKSDKSVIIDGIMIFIGQMWSISSIADITQYKFRDVDFVIFYNTIYKLMNKFYEEMIEVINDYMIYLFDREGEDKSDKRYNKMINLISRCMNFYIDEFNKWSIVREIVDTKHHKSKKPVLNLVANPLVVRRVEVSCDYKWSIMTTRLTEIVKLVLDIDNPTRCVNFMLKVSNAIQEYSTIYTNNDYQLELIENGQNNLYVASRKITNHNMPYKAKYAPFDFECPVKPLMKIIEKYREEVEAIKTFSATDPEHENFTLLLFVLSAMYNTTSTEFMSLSRLGFYNLDAAYQIFSYMITNRTVFKSFFEAGVSMK